MKKLYYLLTIFLTFNSFAQVSWQSSSNPEANQSATILFNKTGTGLASYTGTIYAHTGVTLNGAPWQNVKGTWGNNTTQPALTLVSGTTYKLDLTPSIIAYYGISSGNVTKINIVFRSATGTQQTTDLELNVGSFQSTITAPVENSTTLLNAGQNLTITATATVSATFNLYRNGTLFNSNTGTSYSFTDSNITSNGNYDLQITDGTVTFSKKFSVIVNPGTITQPMPSGVIDGVNYDPSDNSKATLVLSAPLKDFVYVAGSFNNWTPTAAHAMKKDPATGKFWLDITGLTSGTFYTFQYWVCDNTSVPANSPKIVKTADPYSTLVLSPFDDPEIISLGVYPGLPAYPTGQEREVSIIQTGPNAYYQYNWSAATTNFVKPNINDLIIYEVLVRDFDANRTYQDLINRIDYFKNLNINAIQLMPVMEFEGNLSWGYNTAFHLALDKRYGSPAKLKEFIDLCHQNGIAVILDLALNHVFGRSPLVRMWMNDANGDGWADATATTTENPYINQFDRHSYSVGSDLNHFFEPNTQNTSGITNTWGENLANTYSVRTIQHWINEYKIDGYRWDLTKGFTNSCTGGNDACTNSYQADRVAKLKWYADKQWEADNTSLCIFEHLGTGGSYNEEVEWANYRLGEGKGIMQWRKMTDPYANLLKGNTTDLSGVAEGTHRFIGYAESHDEERVGYKALTETGQTQGNLTKLHQRMPAMGALLFLVPGPKMMWHFSDLGWEFSLWQCSNGTTSFSNPDCKLDTKPQPQWTNNWPADANRSAIYNAWAQLIDLKINENVFENGQYSWNFSQVGRPRLDVWTSTTQTANLSYVFVLSNFSDQTYNAVGGFPFTGTWYNLMDNTSFNVINTNQTISIEPGGFRVFGNKQAALSNTNFNFEDSFTVYPNPVNDAFAVSIDTKMIEIYNITGQLVKSFSNKINNELVSVSDLQNGVYLVKVTDNNNNQVTRKFIKQ